MALKKSKSIYTVNFYKIEKQDSKCTEFGFKEDFTSLQLINSSSKRLTNKSNEQKSKKNKNTKTKNINLNKKNKRFRILTKNQIKSNDFNNISFIKFLFF